MSDDRHAADTLFIVAEEEWKCYIEHAEVAVDGERDNVLPTKYQPLPAKSGEPVAPAQGCENDSATCPDEQERKYGSTEWESNNWPNAAKDDICFAKPSDALDGAYDRSGDFFSLKIKKTVRATATPELTDLIHMATSAHRVGRGEFIWASWAPNSKTRVQSIARGSTLLLVSRDGATSIQEVFNSAKPCHVDVALWAMVTRSETNRHLNLARATFGHR